MTDIARIVINTNLFEQRRRQMGGRFFEHLDYLRRDGPVSLRAIEDAMQVADPAAMIVPANRLAEDADMFGAEALAEVAAHIQARAQTCLANRERCDDLLHAVIELRDCFERTMRAIDSEATPLLARKRRTAPRPSAPRESARRASR